MLLKIFIDDKLDLCLFLIVSVFNTVTSVPLPVPLNAIFLPSADLFWLESMRIPDTHMVKILYKLELQLG